LLGVLVSWGVGSILWGILKRLGKYRGKIDLIHCHCSELPWTFIFGPIFAKLLGVPLVLTVHCSALATIHPKTRLEKVYYAFARIAEKKAIKVADRVITLTDRLRRFYISMDLADPSKFSIIPDGIYCDEFLASATPSAIDEFRSGFEIPNNLDIILFVGRIAPEKGWVHFVEAAKILSNRKIHFLVCGDGNQKISMEKMILDLGLKDKFTLTGFISHKHVACAITLSQIVVMPSIHEEMGGTILETMTFGKPIIATTVGGIPEVIQHGVNGWLVKPGDGGEVARAIITLLEDPKLVATIGENGIETVRKRFDMNKLSKDMVEIYRDVIKNSRYV
jgi:2-deoxystreptamine N-acetyl-D-glucosaminyltransferase/2-deoxystreptamine glucosyltransferase